MVLWIGIAVVAWLIVAVGLAVLVGGAIRHADSEGARRTPARGVASTNVVRVGRV